MAPDEGQEPTPADAFEGEYESAQAPSAADMVVEEDEVEEEEPPEVAEKMPPPAPAKMKSKRSAGIPGGVVGGIPGGVVGGYVPSAHSGHFLAAGDDEDDVWGGLTGEDPGAKPSEKGAPRLISTAETKFSTISIDVDTASYARTRSYLMEGWEISPKNVRIEEFVNYFRYGLPDGQGAHPIGVLTDGAPVPWNPQQLLLRVGVKAKARPATAERRKNLVFLIDVSGSMNGADGLELVKYGLTELLKGLSPKDRVGIVVYAGSSGVVLPPTEVGYKKRITKALERLSAGGATNGGQGLRLAYKLAKRHFDKRGINRVILATDGDFNLGIRGEEQLTSYIERKRKSGVYLSVLGFSASSGSDRAMEQLADHGNGNYAYIDSRREARRVLLDQAQGTLTPVADDVKIQVEFDPKYVQRHRVIGYHNRKLAKKDFLDDKKDAGEMGAGQSTTALYQLELTAAGQADPQAALAKVSVRYRPVGHKRHAMFTHTQQRRAQSLDDASDDFRFSAAVAAFGQVLAEEGLEPEALEAIHRVAFNARGEDKACMRGEFVELVKDYACGAQLPGAYRWPKVHGCGLEAMRKKLRRCDKMVLAQSKVPEPAPEPAVVETPVVETPVVEAPPSPPATVTESSSSPFAFTATLLEWLASWLRSLPQWAALVPGALGMGLWWGNRTGRTTKTG